VRDTASEDLDRTCGRVSEKLMRVAEPLVPATRAVHDDFAVPITSTRLSVTPMALVTEGSRAPRIVPAALALDRAARELGVDYVGGFSALVEKGTTPVRQDRFRQSVSLRLPQNARLHGNRNRNRNGARSETDEKMRPCRRWRFWLFSSRAHRRPRPHH
jgi:uncharacterized protein (UPF0210 family)